MDIENNKQLQRLFYRNAVCALTILLICRIISMYFIPLNDVSEARYAEIARKMLETGNWVTPLHDYGVPFWAKPPLSTWLSALSMKFFGVNEFAVRFPSLLLSLGVLWLIWDLARKHSGSFVAMASLLVLSGSLYFFLDAGAVMTDPSLIFCTTLVFVSFWRAIMDGDKLWSYAFFVALGLGLLAKGPVALVLAGMPLFFWVLWRHQWSNLWKRLPWIKGTLIMLMIGLPWYILAEIRTPGFLNYFIIGEHFHRFVTPGWTGDKYGYAHREYWGVIWIFAVSGIFPWSILGGLWFIKYRNNLSHVFRDGDGWLSYFFLCSVVPLMFFTFSSNIIYTYVFPCLSPFALFFVEYWNRVGAWSEAKKLLVGLSLLSGVIFFMATLVFHFMPEYVEKTQKNAIAVWLKQHPTAGSYLIYWDYKTEFSAQFYSRGRARFAMNTQDLCHLLSNDLENYLLVNPSKTGEIAPDLFAKMTQIQRVTAGDRQFFLMRIPVLDCSIKIPISF